MRQTSLFEVQDQSADNDSNSYCRKFSPDFDGWWVAASVCLKHNREPSSVHWLEDPGCRQPSARTGGLPAEFFTVAKAASCHSNDDRWSLLYSVAWRLKNEQPQLLSLAGDAQVARLNNYAKSVSRDVHKMKAFVRFRKVDGESARYVSWFEPQHNIVQYAAPFFKRRFANMKWSILTPVGCAHWEGDGELWFSDAVDKTFAPADDQFEDAWRVYYRSIFNPARLKISAMQSEMPKKYWKNMPEASEISALIKQAEVRTQSMLEQRKSADKLHCGARPSHPDQLLNSKLATEKLTPLQELKLQASLCDDCPQAQNATQTVFGEGSENAQIMIIGEQPGDQEDLQGRPFAGPAGQLLDNALRRAGISREQCYLTNAVKHFHFEPRGKQRIHKKPAPGVIASCHRWLQREIDLVNPAFIIYLGATAASTRFSSAVKISKQRGQLIQADGRQLLITAHPASILRQVSQTAREAAYRSFVQDLLLVEAGVAHAMQDAQ